MRFIARGFFIPLDCEQSLFYFRFGESSARARERHVRNEGGTSPVSRLQSRAWSFACLARFARRTKNKERVLVVYYSTGAFGFV